LLLGCGGKIEALLWYEMGKKMRKHNQTDKENQKGIVNSLIPLWFMYFKNKF